MKKVFLTLLFLFLFINNASAETSISYKRLEGIYYNQVINYAKLYNLKESERYEELVILSNYLEAEERIGYCSSIEFCDKIIL